MAHPERLGKYPIDAVLGEGAMGVVYRAHDPDIGRPVAIKTVRAELLREDPLDAEPGAADGMAARFRNEARAVGRISHPGIVAIYEYGEDAGTAFIAMEYVEGRTLAQLLANGPLLPEPEILRVMDQLLDALGSAHDAGVWHRDIKPANLIVTATGRVKITDFGIARIEHAGLTLVNAQIGTPGYMAPEQYSGSGIDHRADLYAAGVLLYRMLTGRKPFEGGAASVMFKVMQQDPLPPSQVDGVDRPAVYDQIIARALARAPEDRFQSAAEFRRALLQRLQASAEPGSGITDMPTLLRGVPARAVAHDAATLRPPAAEAAVTRSRSGASLGGTAGATEGTGLAVTGWDMALLAPVERALAAVVGPMARVMVRQAARRCADLQTLTERLLAELANEADRERFVARLEAGTTRATAASAGTGLTRGVTDSSPAGGGEGPSEEMKAQAIRVLTVRVGPIARVLVKRAAEQSRSADDFVARLAALADGVDAAQLRRELGM